MPPSFPFRRSTFFIQPCITVTGQPQLRRHFSSRPQLPSPPTQPKDPSTLTKWISGIITGSGTGVALYYFSSPSQLPSFSFADSSETPPAITPVVDLERQNQITTDDDEKRPNHPRFLFGDAYRRKIFFNYEKRIRTRSPPEKVFEYFASFRSGPGEIFMTPADLMRAVVPVFPPSESHLVRDGYLRGERSPGDLRCDPSEFFMLFDTNNDGLISFKEYIFFVTLLSIPESSFSVTFKMFDLDSNGEAIANNCLTAITIQSVKEKRCKIKEIDRDEFKRVMALMRAQNRQGAFHSDGLRAGRRVGSSVENGGILEYFFGKYGEKRLHHDTFVQFLRDLHDEILRLEFAHYDYKLQGTISAKDFALSMVTSADLKEMNRLLDRVDSLDHELRLRNIRLTFEEFKDFAKLRKLLHPFSLALFSYGKVNGLLTRNDLKRAASQVCGISLSDNVIELIFHVFDANKDGNLSYDEFVRVLKQREKDIAQPTDTGILSFLRGKSSYSIPGFMS